MNIYIAARQRCCIFVQILNVRRDSSRQNDSRNTDTQTSKVRIGLVLWRHSIVVLERTLAFSCNEPLARVFFGGVSRKGPK